MSRLCKCDDLQETGDTAATGYIGLEYVDSAVRKKVTAIVERKDIFTRRDLQPCRSLTPNSVQTCWIVGGDRLLEPANVQVLCQRRKAQCLLYSERAIGIDKQLTISDGPRATSTRFGSCSGSLPIFILTNRQPSIVAQRPTCSHNSSFE